ncbi:MAG: YfhO family protein [Clostridia bacterium]|nr:YfhO family protein [Clostridia bacterium]
MNSNTALSLNCDNNQNKIKFSPYLLWAFFVPAVLYLAVYLIRGVYPIGDGSVLVLDLNAQYVYFFEELRDILQGNGSLLYSWQRSLGGEFMGMFAYYLASPFNLLIVLFPENAITEALLTIFVLKAGLSGFNFAVYLHYSDRMKNKYASVIFSTMYALTSYAMVNAHNTMWIDVLLFLPLVILGLEELINQRKYKLYTIVLAVSIISNFYIGFMLCVFIFVYAIYYYCAYGYSEEYNKSGESFHTLKSFLRVLLFSALAIGMAAVIIFTIYYSLKFGKNDFSDPDYTLNSKFNLLDLFAKMLPNSYDTVRPEGLPFVYCGVLSLVLVPVFFISRKITPREKIAAGFILSVMVILFSASTLDIFMHGLQKPNWLNYRYSFMFCFLLVVFAHHAFNYLKDINFNHIVAICGGLVLLTVIVQNEEYKFIDNVLCIWISLICIGIYMLTLYAVKKEKITNFTSLILAILVSAELLINGYVNLDSLDKDVIFTSRTAYRDYINQMRPLADYVLENDTSFYRFEKTSHRRTNDNMTLDINGISSSTSTLNASIVKLLNQLGYSSKSHWSKYYGGTPATDALLGIKYIITDDDLNEEFYKELHRENDFSVYQSKYAQSIAFAVSRKTEYVDFSFHETPFELMNELVTAMLDSDSTIQLFKPIENITETTTNASKTQATSLYTKYVPQKEGTNAIVSYTFTVPSTDEIYFFYPSDYPRKVKLMLNNRDWGTFFDNETDRIVSLSNFEEDETVNLKVTLADDNLYILTDQHYFYYMDAEVYKEVMTRLSECSFEVTEHSDTKLKGTINVNEDDSLLFTSIPYDEGWHIYCDGKELDLAITADSLLAARIDKGEHELEFIYRPNCLIYGCIVASASFVVFVTIIILDEVLKKKKRRLLVQKAVDDFYEEFEMPEDIATGIDTTQIEETDEINTEKPPKTE